MKQTAQVEQVPKMNRQQRRARAKPAKNAFRPVDLSACATTLKRHQVYEPGAMLKEFNIIRAAFERLRNGAGSIEDADEVGFAMNVGLIRALDIDSSLTQTIHSGQMAIVRMGDRHRRGLALGFDAQGLRDLPEALDAYLAIVEASTPQQMILACRQVVEWTRKGLILKDDQLTNEVKRGVQ